MIKHPHSCARGVLLNRKSSGHRQEQERWRGTQNIGEVTTSTLERIGEYYNRNEKKRFRATQSSEKKRKGVTKGKFEKLRFLKRRRFCLLLWIFCDFGRNKTSLVQKQRTRSTQSVE
jgi:hypothetical protein